MRVRSAIPWLAVLATVLAGLSGPIWRSLAAPVAPDAPASAASIAPDPFGIAHISAVNAQVPTYGSLRYQQAAAAGAAWNRWVFYWQDIEASAGNPDYTPQENTANQDVANGFRYKIDAVLMGTPAWASTAGATAASGTIQPPPRVGPHRLDKASALDATAFSGPSTAVYPPQNLDQSVFSDGTDFPGTGKAINQNNYWARFVYNTVNRFKDRINHWEIWNEPDYYPNTNSGWYGFWYGTADQYFRLLKVAYLAAKSADPSAVIIMGGMAYWPEVVQLNKQPFTFFNRVLSLATTDPLGPANNYFFDRTAWHWYNRSNQAYYMVQNTQSDLNGYGLGSKPIWINESGLPAWDDPAKPPSGGNSPYFGSGTMTEQASYMLQAMAYGLAAGVERHLIFQEYDDGNGEAFGLVRNDGTPRPAYYAYQMAARYLTGTYSASLSSQGSASIVTAYTSSGTRVVALWNNSPTQTQVSVPSTAGSALLLGQPTEANPYGTQQTIYPGGGQYVITLPGATDNNGTSSSDYIVGGPVSLIVETNQASSTPTPTPSPTPTLSPQPTGLIENGGFELQPAFTEWTTAASGSLPAQLSTFSHTGQYSALLGANYVEQAGLGGANSTITQIVTLPAQAQQLSLTFVYLLNTSQPSPVNLSDPSTYDKFEVSVIDSAGQPHVLLTDWTGQINWTPASLDLSPYRGQQVTIVFNVWQSANTSNYPTTVYLDDVTLWPFSAALPSTVKNTTQ